jgi:hypothetical protein
LRPLSTFGSEPPERAMVNFPFFSRDSFWALMMKDSRDSARTLGEGNEYRMGAFGGWCIPDILAVIE